MDRLLTDHEAAVGSTDDVAEQLAYLQGSAWVLADQVAVRFGDDSTTYHKLLDRVQGAGALRGAGLAAGDWVALLLPNVPAMFELQFAVPGAGGVRVPINTCLGRGEVAFILEHSGARFLIAHDRLRAVALDALAGMPDPPRLVVAGAASEARTATTAGWRGPSRSSWPGPTSTRCCRSTTPAVPPANPRVSCTCIEAPTCTRWV